MAEQKRYAFREMYEPSAMMGAVLALSGIKGVEIAFHGPGGCYTIATHIRTDQAPLGVYSEMRPSGITEDNLVMGTSEEKLRQLLKFIKADTRVKPSLLAIVNTDATAITGDDIAGQARRFEEESGVPSIAVDAPGMKGWDVIGYDLSYKALLSKFAGKDGVEKKENSVNLIAPYMLSSQNWIFDLEGIKNLLKKIDIDVNCILTRNTTLQDLERFSAAKLNLMLTNEDLPLFDKETERLGVPNFGAELPLPYGLQNTEEWYLAVANQLGKTEKAQEVLREASKATKGVLSFNYTFTWLANLVMQKRAAIIGRSAFAASIARFLFYDMDAYPTIVALQGATHQSLDKAKKLLEPVEKDGYPVKILENPPYIEFARAIKEEGVDFVIGSRIEKTLVEGMNFPHLSLGSAFYFQSFRFVPYPYVGYEGALYLIQELALVMADMFHEKDIWRRMLYENI